MYHGAGINDFNKRPVFFRQAGACPLIQTGGCFTLFPLFLCLAAGLGMLIYGSSRLEQYKFLKHSNLILSPSLQASVADMQANFQPQCAVITTVGIVLCVLAPFTLIALSQLGESTSLGEEYGGTIGIFFLFLFISIAVYLFITAGSEEDIYKILLQEKKKEGKKKRKLLFLPARPVRRFP